MEGGKTPSAIRWENACASLPSWENAWVTDAFLIGVPQIKNHATCAKRYEFKELAASSWQDVGKNVCTPWEEKDTSNSWREDDNHTAWLDDESGNSMNCFYNDTVLVDYSAFLSGMADDLIHPNFWLPSHGACASSSAMGLLLTLVLISMTSPAP